MIFVLCTHLKKLQLRRFALRFIHSHSDATGVFRNVFLGTCRVDDFREPYALNMTPLPGSWNTESQTDREQGLHDLVMRNVLIVVLVNPPLSASER